MSVNGRSTPLRAARANASSGSSVPSMWRWSSAFGRVRRSRLVTGSHRTHPPVWAGWVRSRSAQTLAHVVRGIPDLVGQVLRRALRGLGDLLGRALPVLPRLALL